MDGQSYGRMLGAAFYGLFFIGLSVGVFLLNVVLVALKLFGVLSLSWWWIAGLMPAAIVVGFIISIIIAGCKAIFGR